MGDTKTQKNIENYRIMYWKQCKIAETMKIQNNNGKLAIICEKIIEQMKSAKCWSENDRLWHSQRGLFATLRNKILPLKEKKRKIRYFLPIIEEALHIRQGVDGRNTYEKSNLETLKRLSSVVLDV